MVDMTMKIDGMSCGHCVARAVESRGYQVTATTN